MEIPAGSRNKYEYFDEAGVMALDRVLHSSVRYPFDYGFIPNTLAEDGAPLDAMVIMEEPTFAGVSLIHISEPTRPERIGCGVVGV